MSKKKVLLVVDLQKQFADGNDNVSCENIANYIKDNEKDYDYVIVTIFSQEIYGYKNDLFSDKLHWDECASCGVDDLLINTNKKLVLLKNSYGITLKGILEREDITVDLVGCNADASILAICFRLWDNQYDFRVLSDYIYSKNTDKGALVSLLKRNFGDCVV